MKHIRTSVIVVAIAFVTLWLAAGATASPVPVDVVSAVHTTTGPTPPPGARPSARSLARRQTAGDHLISGVPAYIWRDGCGPTSVGMIIGYYDGAGFPGLIAGDASTQTSAVGQAIASHGTPGDPQHYDDYSLPKDSGSTVAPDKSELPIGDEHASDCVADYMHTSWSVDGLTYGGSWSNMVGPAFTSYVAARLTGAEASYADYYWNGFGPQLTFAVLQTEIDAGRPMVFLVDSSGDGETDHAIAVIGYRVSGGTEEYGFYSTWDSAVMWVPFRGLSKSYPWGVWGGTTFSLSGGTPPDPGADVTPPVTSVAGADSLWHATPVILTFTASDDASSLDFAETELDAAGWSPFASLPGELLVKGQGVHQVRYRSRDLSGNLETARSCQVRIDGLGPVTTVRGATVKKGAVAILRYRVRDLTAKAVVELIVRTPGGVRRATLRLGLRGTNVARACSWRCGLPRGTYRLVAHATDEAGNRQRPAASAKLVVR
jgi:hypothetical protein